MANTPIQRCAIYTRKPSEEGLEQDFNSAARAARGLRGVHQEPSGRRMEAHKDGL